MSKLDDIAEEVGSRLNWKVVILAALVLIGLYGFLQHVGCSR